MNEKQIKARNFLQSYDVTLRQLKSCAQDYARAQSAAHNVTATLGDGFGGSPSSDKMADAAVDCMEIGDSLDGIESPKLYALISQRNEVVRAVAARNALMGDILQCMYIERMTVKETMRYLERDRNHPYATSSIYRLRDRALEAAYREMVARQYGDR